MNIGLITARLNHDPFQFSSFGRYFTEVQVGFLHAKSYFATAVILGEGKIANNISEFYCKGDYILVEGECIVIENSSWRIHLIIYANDIQPAHLIIKE